MATILHYLYQYVKFGKFTTFFLILIAVVLLGKHFLKWRSPFSNRTLFVAILLLGLFLRIGWLCYSSHTTLTHWSPKTQQENDLINIHAIELTQGIWFHDADGIPSGRRPIGYPLFLALFYKIFGPHLLVAWIVNLFLYVLTLFFLYKMSQQLFGDAVAMIASLLFAIYPMSIYSIKLITDEHLFLPLWYGGIYMLFKILDGRRIPWDWLWLGLIFGYTTMVRTHTIFMPFVVGLVFWLLKRPFREVATKIILVALVMQLINLPWAVRNYKVWKVPVLYTATSFFVYAQVNSTAGPEGGGHIPLQGEPGYSPELAAAFKSGNEGRMHQVANREMKKWIVRHPAEFLSLGTSRLLYFMNFNRQGGVWAIWYQYYPGAFDPARPLSKKMRKSIEEYAFAFYYIVFFSSLISMIVLFRRRKTLPAMTKKGLWVLAACFLFWFLEHMVIYPDRKYRFPLEPLMLITTAYFLYNLCWPRFLTRIFQKLHKAPALPAK